MQNKTETRKHSGLSSLSSLIIKSNVLGVFHQQCSYQYHGADTSKTLWYFKWEGVGLDGWISGVRYRCRVAPWEGSRWMDLRVVKSTYGANNQNHISFGLQNKGHLSFSQVCFAYVVWDRLSKDCAANNGSRMMNELGEWLLASTPLLAKTPPAFNIHFFRCNSIS